MKYGKFFVGSLTTVLVVLMITPLVVNLSSNPVPRVADTNDGYDPNSTFGTAKSIPAGWKHNLYVDHDDDWFYIYVANSYRLSVSLNWTGGSDLDLYIFDSNQVQLNYSWYSNPEQVSYDVITPGFYYIQVTKWSGSETLYSLYVSNSVRTTYKLLTLTDAYNSSNMSTTIHGTGSLYGASLNINLQWVAGYTEYAGVRVTMPLGYIVQPVSSGYTNLVIAYAVTVNLSYVGDSELSYVYAFGTDLHADTPQGFSDLIPYGIYTTTSNTYKVLKYCAVNNYYNMHEGQLAVWVTTEGESSVTSQYYSSYEVSTVNAILSGAGTGLHLQSFPGPILFLTIFIPVVIVIVVIIIVAVAVSVKRKGRSRRIAIRSSMNAQPVQSPPATFAPAPQPTVTYAPQAPVYNPSYAPIQAQTPVVNAEPPKVEVKSLSCHSCGAKLEPGQRFCQNCGSEQ